MPGTIQRLRQRPADSSPPTLGGPLSFRTLPEQVVARLRHAIVTGKLHPGTRLIEMRIAEQMQTSRGPVREAIGLLEREGLVVKVPHRGACVLDFDPRLLRESASLRGRLEEFAVSLALPRLGVDDLARLESLIQGMEDAARRHAVQEFNNLDYRFHDAIFQRTGHHILHEVWRGMQRRFRVFLASTNAINRNLQMVAQRHRAILVALASRKPADSRRAIRGHFAWVEKELVILLGAYESPKRMGRGRRRRSAPQGSE
jgi:DNA-binding GntR family transcriptional regulator